MVTTLDHSTVRSADGTRIAWQRSGDGPPVVLLHGTSADASSWALSGRYLSRDLELYAVDRRGRGASDAGEPYTFAREIEDLAAVVAAMPEVPHVVAHSFGAAVALAAVAEGLEVRSLVLYEPPLAAADHVDAEAVAAACTRALEAGDAEEALRCFYRAFDDEPAVDLLKQVPPVFARFLDTTPTIPRELRAAAGFGGIDGDAVDVPTLLLSGSDSPAYLRDAVDSLHDQIVGSRRHVFAGQAHLAQARVPEEFAAVVGDFVRAVDADAGADRQRRRSTVRPS